MAKSQNSFIKQQKVKKRMQKKKEKEARKEARKENNNRGAELEDMIVYVDENGNLTSEKPEPKVIQKNPRIKNN